MLIKADKEIASGFVAGRLDQLRLMGTFFFKITCRLEPGKDAVLCEEPLPISGDCYAEQDSKKLLVYPSDFAPFKPLADLLLVGSAHAPGGKPLKSLLVSMRVGTHCKAVEVVGPRAWGRRLFFWRRPSDPESFVSMPLDYTRSFGGEGYNTNPIGRDSRSPLAPTIEHVTRKDNQLEPAGFGPIDPSWKQRISKVGTYKGAWMRQQWPWFPEDFDWTYFNAAPRDQQIQGYLRGDEELEFENLHAHHPLYKSRLPGLRVRCFLSEREAAGGFLFREVPLHLDTLWINMDEEQVILVWRGVAPVRTLKLREIEQLFAITESVSERSRTLEECRAMLRRRFDEGEDQQEAKTEVAKQGPATIGTKGAKIEADLAAKEAEERDQLLAAGVPPVFLEASTQEAPRVSSKEQLEAALAQLKISNPEFAANWDGAEIAEVEQGEGNARSGKAPSRESVQAALAKKETLGNLELSGLDLSGLDLSGADLSRRSLRKANLKQSILTRANLANADLSGADLSGADLTNAVLDHADFTKAILAKAKLTGVSLTGTILSGLGLKGLNFSGAKGKSADFSKSDLVGAQFCGSHLPEADFSGTNLEQADFAGAEIPGAHFDGTQAKGIRMENADISGLQAGSKSDFTGGNFRAAKAAGSLWQEAILTKADFSRALLMRANFAEASLREATFDRAEAQNASFDDACLCAAVLTNANFLRATFDRADLTRANLTNCNLYNAGLWETVFDKTVLNGAKVKETLLA